jgi:hypothetical protein
MASYLNGTGITFNSGNSMNESPLGTGQSWSNVTASRVLGTTYTNSTGRPIAVLLQHNPYSGGTQIDDNGTRFWSTGSETNVVYWITWIIPPGRTYAFNANFGTLYRWLELR